MGRKQIDIMKRDHLLIDFLWRHKGRENNVSAKSIVYYLNTVNYPAAIDSINTIIRKLINDYHLPICSLNGKGYYWGQSKEDITACIKHLQSRIDKLQEHINTLKNFIID